MRMSIEAVLFISVYIGMSCLVSTYRELNIKYFLGGWTDFIIDLSDSSPSIHLTLASRIMKLKMKVLYPLPAKMEA